MLFFACVCQKCSNILGKKFPLLFSRLKKLSVLFFCYFFELTKPHYVKKLIFIKENSLKKFFPKIIKAIPFIKS